MLITGDQAKERIQQRAESSSRLWCYSAFVTKPAVEWVKSIYGESCRLLVRGRVDDFITGGSNLDAIENALNAGWEVRFSSMVHFKVYFFDDSLIVGSSNLTGRGLALVPNNNDELNTEVSIDNDDLLLAEHLWSQGRIISLEIINRMRDYLSSLEHHDAESVPNEWPEEVLPVVERDMYCSDFPQSVYGQGECVLNLKSLEDLQDTVSYQWILSVVKENDGSAHFGLLSTRLHNDVADDPVPYRRDIKTLVANLLSYIEALDSETLQVTQPRHSQVVSLRRA